ncbi:MAG TPA: FtsX-like permease family protein [Candidatus Acidoferrales bacterium]|nr:FtsX-like permease family protein [Candidatus Acidoferrales bacterium]
MSAAWTLFTSLVLGHLRTNVLRSLVTLVAVALGVAIALAIDLANATAVDSFASSVNVVSNHVNLQVLGVGNGFDERVFPRIERIGGVQYASPAIEDAVVVGARPNDPFSGEILRVLGVDVVRPLPRDAGGSSNASSGLDETSTGADLYRLIDGRGVILSQRVAQRYHLHAGSVLPALAGARPIQLVVSGILPPTLAGVDSSVAFVDIVTAQELFGKVGLLDRIDCIVDPARLPSVQAQIQRVLPPGTRAIQPRVRTGEIRRMLRSFQINLAALAYIALLVGMYLIYNTVAISVVQRRPEIGTLRAVGATRTQIFWTFVAEGMLFGLVGSVLGLALGAFLAQPSVSAVARTVSTIYVGTHADHVVYAAPVLIKAFVVGLLMATFSAVVPALEAATTAPAITLRSAGFEGRSAARPDLRLGALALVLLLCAGITSRAPAIDGIPLLGYLSGLCIIFGASLLMPLLIAGIAWGARRGSAGLPPSVRLGVANMGAAPLRNSVAIASLMIAVGMMISIAVLIGSFRTTINAWAAESLQADLFIRPLGLADATYDARFSPLTVERLRRLPGVAAVDTFTFITIPFRGTITNLGAVDFATLAARPKTRFLGKVDVQRLAATLPGSLGVLASEPFVTRFGMHVGDVIPVETPSGEVNFRLAAVYNDYSSDAGVFLVDERTFARLFHDDNVNSLAVYVQPGADIVRVRTRILRSMFPLRVDVQTNRELRSLVIAIFNRTFAITYALYFISITIAVLGVVTTLFALVLERRRQIAFLRYLGLSISQVRRMVLAEAALIGFFGGLCGVAVGMLLALLLIFVIDRQSFGWLIELHVPYDFLVEAVAMVVVVALLAGLYPASVAARIRTAEALRTE